MNDRALIPLGTGTPAASERAYVPAEPSPLADRTPRARLVVHAAGLPASDALNVQDLADPIVATLVGAIALLISVPLTTALASLLAAPIPAAALPADAHHHQH